MAATHERGLKMLSLIPWLNTMKSSTFGEISRRFDYKPKKLLEDLMAIYCAGLPPYGPGELIELKFQPEEEVYQAYEEGAAPQENWSVEIRLAQNLTHPPNLAPDEVLNLLLLNSAIQELGLGIETSLNSAMEKIKSRLGSEGDWDIQLNLEPPKNEIISILESAIEEKMQVEIDYHSLRENRRSLRLVEPWRIFFVENAWYLIAYDYPDKTERLFRIARVISAKVSSSSFAQQIPKDIGEREPLPYLANPDDPRIILELDSHSRWALDFFSYEKIEYLDGYKIHVTVPVSNDEFLEKLLLQIGPGAHIISGSYPKDFGKQAAKKLLKKHYQK